MQQQITTIYCLCDDFLRAWGHHDDPQAHMTTAEVMTVALVAPVFFGGNQDRSRCFLKGHGYIKRMLSKGRLNRRLRQVPEALWQALFALLAQVHQQINAGQEYVVDSMPVPACDNIRIRRSRLYPRRRHGEKYRGYVASKRRYVYGLRVHLLITASGQPVEVALAPASEADIAVFRRMTLDLPAGAHLFQDLPMPPTWTARSRTWRAKRRAWASSPSGAATAATRYRRGWPTCATGRASAWRPCSAACGRL